MTNYFELSDAPDYARIFPILADKAIIGAGQFSIVFEGATPDTALKLTCDAASVHLMLTCGKPAGLQHPIRVYPEVYQRAHGNLYLIELPRLQPINSVQHPLIAQERDAVRFMVQGVVDQNDLFFSDLSSQKRLATGLLAVSRTSLFSKSTLEALGCIGRFLDQTRDGVLLDMFNINNYMTDGERLIITDPIQPVELPETDKNWQLFGGWMGAEDYP